METKKLKFKDIFIYSVAKFESVFDLFSISIWKFFLYFIILNLMMMIPLTIGIINLEVADYSRYGMDFADELPEWIPEGLPTSCVIENHRLSCADDTVYQYQITNNDTVYDIYFNASTGTQFEDTNAIVFYESVFHVYFSNRSVMEFSYSGFNYLNFADLHSMTQEEASDVLFDSIFRSIRPSIILPLMLYTLGILMLTNFLLIVAISALSMMFKFTQTGFLKYPDMIKLMIVSSTFPSFVNLALNSFGMSAFTSISYNYITPVIAFVIYRMNKSKEIHNY